VWEDVAVPDQEMEPDSLRAWVYPEAGRLIGKGHPAGDFLEAYDWDLLEESTGYLKVSCHLPQQAKNPRGQLFGGFTPTYVDIIALFTVRAGQGHDARTGPRKWMATTNMRIDYFEPIVGPRFIIDSRLEKARGRTKFVTTRFLQDEELAVHAVTIIREVAMDRSLGDA
jgi:acyl-coenzyme A thioesterase PaaI-like protein